MVYRRISWRSDGMTVSGWRFSQTELHFLLLTVSLALSVTAPHTASIPSPVPWSSFNWSTDTSILSSLPSFWVGFFFFFFFSSVFLFLPPFLSQNEIHLMLFSSLRLLNNTNFVYCFFLWISLAQTFEQTNLAMWRYPLVIGRPGMCQISKHWQCGYVCVLSMSTLSWGLFLWRIDSSAFARLRLLWRSQIAAKWNEVDYAYNKSPMPDVERGPWILNVLSCKSFLCQGAEIISRALQLHYITLHLCSRHNCTFISKENMYVSIIVCVRFYRQWPRRVTIEAAIICLILWQS